MNDCETGLRHPPPGCEAWIDYKTGYVLAYAVHPDTPIWDAPFIHVAPGFLIKPPVPWEVTDLYGHQLTDTMVRLPSGVLTDGPRIWKLTGRPHHGACCFFEAAWPD